MAVDQGTGGAAALNLAVALTEGHPAAVTLLGVVPYVDAPAPASEVAVNGMPVLSYDAFQNSEDRVRTWLEATAARLPGRLDVSLSVGIGPPGDAVADVLGARDYAMVLLPWHGTGRFGHLLHDHSLRHVLDHTRIPVVLVPTTTVAAETV